MAETDAVKKTSFTVSSSACQNYFGFLNRHTKGTTLPEACLTCEKMLDCLVSKSEGKLNTVETKQEVDFAEMFGEPVIVVEEVEGTIIMEKSKAIPKASKKKNEPVLEHQLPKSVKKNETKVTMEKVALEKLDDGFCVESPGLLYSQWSSTVLISKETLESWGRKVKEVELRTLKGKKTRCKVYAVPDMAPEGVQVPAKIKAYLEIDNGSRVTVKPVAK
jgi:hypothetical protein